MITKKFKINLFFKILIFYFSIIILYGCFKLSNLNNIYQGKLYILAIIVSIFFIFIFVWIIKKLNDNVKINITISCITFFICLLSLEIYLFYGMKTYYVDRDQKLVNAAKKAGVTIDLVIDKTEIQKKYKINNNEELHLWTGGHSFLNEKVLSKASNEKNILPLGALANKKILLCNENGYYLIYQSDKHGFANNNKFYNKENLKIMMVGDSYTEGACVHSEENIQYLLNQENIGSVSFGKGGNSSLLNLATLREYVLNYKPPVVLWMHYENDIDGIESEFKNPILLNYLNNKNYTQNLISRQNEIDRIILESKKERQKVIDKETNEGDKLNIFYKNIFFSTIKFTKTREIIKIAIVNYKKSRINYTKFKKIINSANNSIKEYGGTMYFVYLPSYYNFNKNINFSTKIIHVLEIINNINIPIINIQETFQSHENPMKLFPFGQFAHYNKAGYELVTKTIIKRLIEDKKIKSK